MQPRRRTPLAVLLATVGLLLAAPAARAVDPKLLPADTEVVVTINLQQILASEAAKANKKLVEQAKFLAENQLAEKGAGKYLEKAGFKVFRDLTSITFASPGGKDPEAFLLIAEGKFDAKKIEAAAKDAAQDNEGALKIASTGGQTVFEVSPKGEKVVYITFLDDTTMLASASKEIFAGALGRAGGTKAGGLKKEFKALMQTAGGKQSFSMVATGPALARMVENAPVDNAEAAAVGLQAVDALSFGITVVKNITFQVGINAKDQEAAEQIAKASNGALVLARTMVKNKAAQEEKLLPVQDIVQTLRVVTQGNNIVIRGEVTFENLGKLLQNLPQQQDQ